MRKQSVSEVECSFNNTNPCTRLCALHIQKLFGDGLDFIIVERREGGGQTSTTNGTGWMKWERSWECVRYVICLKMVNHCCNFSISTQMPDWYKISRRQVEREKGGVALLGFYRSLPHALRVLYRDFSWEPQLFAQSGRLPTNHLADFHSQKKMIEKIAQELGIVSMEGWYNVTTKTLKAKGAGILLQRYGSQANMMQAFYPHFKWQDILFKSTNRIPAGYWKDKANMDLAFDRAERRLSIRKVLIAVIHIW